MSKQLFIPEIKDQIILSEDWTFELYAERRNTDLAKLHGFYLNDGWINENELAPLRDPDYDIKYPDPYDSKYNTGYFRDKGWQQLKKDQKAAEDNCSEYQQWIKDSIEFNRKARQLGKENIQITIPKGTILQIDRIYIRKGASDYSSITFYAKNLGEINTSTGYYTKKKIKKSSLRFWAKLIDCNKIKFE